MKPIWIDQTNYKRGEPRETTEPRTWTLTVYATNQKLVVTRHVDYPGEWIMRADDFGHPFRALKSKTAYEAKAEALEIVRKALKAALEELS